MLTSLVAVLWLNYRMARVTIASNTDTLDIEVVEIAKMMTVGN